MSFKHYISIARPAHWLKNVFILPGTAIAVLLTNVPIYNLVRPIVLGTIAVCIICSANYTINEWLDSEFDRFHPLKKNRPSVLGQIHPSLVFLQYCVLAVFGLSISYFVSKRYLAVAVFFLIMGLLYNVNP